MDYLKNNQPRGKKELVKDLYTKLILIGAVSGAIYSGGRKLIQLLNEPTYEYKEINSSSSSTELIRVPLQGIYQTSRIAIAASTGAIVGGVASASAPISIPIYYYLSHNKYKEQKGIEEIHVPYNPKYSQNSSSCSKIK